VKEETLSALKAGFDSVRLLGKDDALEVSIELWQHMDEDDFVLFWRKRHPGLGEGYVFMPIPDPELFDDDAAMIQWAVRAAEESYDLEVANYERGRPDRFDADPVYPRWLRRYERPEGGDDPRHRAATAR
jgi:hypothetical protein